MEITEPFVELVTSAHRYLSARQDALRESYQLASYPRYDWDQSTGKLVFSAAGIPKVIADIQFVGTVSTSSGTWLWSWANRVFSRDVTRDILEVRMFGESRGIAQLTTPSWNAEEVDGWEMTTIAAYVLQAKGAYRTPGDDGFTYMIMRRVGWAEEWREG